MYMDRILADEHIVKTIKFYAERRDWANLYNNLHNKNVLFHSDSPSSIAEELKKHPEFSKNVVQGQLKDLHFLLCSNRLKDFRKKELEELRQFIDSRINLIDQQ